MIACDRGRSQEHVTSWGGVAKIGAKALDKTSALDKQLIHGHYAWQAEPGMNTTSLDHGLRIDA